MGCSSAGHLVLLMAARLAGSKVDLKVVLMADQTAELKVDKKVDHLDVLKARLKAG